MRIFRQRERLEPMPLRFNELADYNARVWKGVAHTPEYAARMAQLQAEFDEWNRADMVRAGYVAVDAVLKVTSPVSSGTDTTEEQA
jgi:hypothetical protein